MFLTKLLLVSQAAMAQVSAQARSIRCYRERFGDGGPSVTIKSHHNVGGLPDDMGARSSSSPCVSCSRMKSGRWGVEMGMPEHLVGRHPFPVQGWRSAFPARSRPKNVTCCGVPTVFTSKKSAMPVFMMRSGRPLPYCCRSRRSA